MPLSRDTLTLDHRQLSISCCVFRDSNQAIPTGVFTPVSFSTQNWDTPPNVQPFLSEMWVIGSPTIITIPVDGMYLVNGMIRWAGGVAGTYREVRIFAGGAVWASNRIAPSAVAINNIITTTISLNAGQTVTLQVFQDTGGNVNLISAGFWGICLEVSLIHFM